MKNQLLILVLYVYVLVLIREEQQIVRCKKDLTYEFKDFSLMHYFLEVWQRKNEIFPFATKAHNSCVVKVSYDGLQIHDLTVSF